MTLHQDRGAELRAWAKTLVLEFMAIRPECQPSENGMRQAELFKQVGFDWGEYSKATTKNQRYWIVALLRELEAEGKVQQVAPSGPWRLA